MHFTIFAADVAVDAAVVVVVAVDVAVVVVVDDDDVDVLVVGTAEFCNKSQGPLSQVLALSYYYKRTTTPTRSEHAHGTTRPFCVRKPRC